MATTRSPSRTTPPAASSCSRSPRCRSSWARRLQVVSDLRTAYRRSGVDVAAGERAVELMRQAVESTRRPEVLSGIGGFGSAVALPAGMREPVLVASTDGVGTKTAIAAEMHRYDTIGLDLVAMCADDVVCAGAEPLFFLDYVAWAGSCPRASPSSSRPSRAAASSPAAPSSAGRRRSIRGSWSPRRSTSRAAASASSSATS